MKKKIIEISTITIYLFLGLILGIVIDKDWLNNEQLTYIRQLEADNQLLVQEKQAWISYVGNEFNQVKFYTTAENEQFQNLYQVLASIGVTLEKLPKTMGVYQQQGIIISLGEELEETYGLPHLNLQSIPKHNVEVNLMYLSLLRMKEELLQ